MYPFPGTASPEMSARLRNEAETIGEIAIDVYRNTDHYATDRVSVESADTTGNTHAVISLMTPRQRGRRLLRSRLRSPVRERALAGHGYELGDETTSLHPAAN